MGYPTRSLATIALFGTIPCSLYAEDARLTQFLLQTAGYEVGSIDGVVGPQTRQALATFLDENGHAPSSIDTLDILVRWYLDQEGDLAPPSSSERFSSFDELQASFVYAGSRGDRDWNVRYKLQPPMRYINIASGQPKGQGFFVVHWGGTSGAVDLNGDGNDDWPFVVNAGNHPALARDSTCSPVESCAPGGVPVAYLNSGDGTWKLRAGWFTDEREHPGDVGAMPSVFADFNGDGIVDIFLGGTAGSRPFRDSYYLSEEGRGHVESSTTHVDRVVASFSHGVSVGDIDRNGWDDVVITSWWTTGSNFICYMNLGYGFMSVSPDCGARLLGETYMSTSHTLADVNGDGAWDLVYSGDEKFNGGVGVALNDGTGVFRRGIDISAETLGYFNVMPNVFAFDLDGDGDQDVIGWVHRDFYNGGGVVIYENIDHGNEWRQQIIPLVTPDPSDPQYHSTLAQETGPWNLWIHKMHFEDVNEDGRIDIVLDGSDNNGRSARGERWSMTGTVEINGQEYPRDGSVTRLGWDQVFGAALVQKPDFTFEWVPRARLGISERKFR